MFHKHRSLENLTVLQMHPGNSGLSGGAFTLRQTLTGEKKKERKKRGKKGKKEESLPRLLFLYRLSMYPRMQCKALCHAIHHLYINHTRS